MSGNCHVDADCGAGGYCSPVFAACSADAIIIGYQCHTQKDKCVIDADCGVDLMCTFVPNEGWACRAAPGCPQ